MTFPRRNKFKAKKKTVDNIVFSSKLEASRYLELKILEKAGEISNLKLQPVFNLIANGIYVGMYTPDFIYTLPSGEAVIEEVKGFRTKDYSLRKRVFEACYAPWKITEWPPKLKIKRRKNVAKRTPKLPKN